MIPKQVPANPIKISVERLLEDKVAVSYANGLTTPLHAAASKNRAQVARALLVFGMDVNPTNSHGQTPLAVGNLAILTFSAGTRESGHSTYFT